MFNIEFNVWFIRIFCYGMCTNPLGGRTLTLGHLNWILLQDFLRLKSMFVLVRKSSDDGVPPQFFPLRVPCL